MAFQGHDVSYYDPAKSLTSTAALEDADLVAVCVPTTHRDVKALSAALAWCSRHCRPHTDVIIKSTVPPGFTEAAQAGYSKLSILFCPEFLTEATANEDAAKPARVIVGYPQGRQPQAERVLRSLPHAPYQAVMPATAAELVKLFSNGLYAVKVAFANLMYDLASELGVSYAPLIQAMMHDPMTAPHHLDVHHKGYRGFAGNSLPEDLHTLIDALQERGEDDGGLDFAGILTAVDEYNESLLSVRTCERCGEEFENEDVYDVDDKLCGECFESAGREAGE